MDAVHSTGACYSGIRGEYVPDLPAHGRRRPVFSVGYDGGFLRIRAVLYPVWCGRPTLKNNHVATHCLRIML